MSACRDHSRWRVGEARLSWVLVFTLSRRFLPLEPLPGREEEINTRRGSRSKAVHHLRALAAQVPLLSLETRDSGLESPKAAAAKLHSPNMEHTGPQPQPSGSLGTVGIAARNPLWGVWLSREMLLISSKAQPNKGKEQSAHSQREAWPCILLPAPPLPTEQKMGHIPTPCNPWTSPFCYSPLWVLLVLLVGPSCPVLGYYHDVGVVSFVFRLQAWQVCRRWHTPGCGNFPETL